MPNIEFYILYITYIIGHIKIKNKKEFYINNKTLTFS